MAVYHLADIANSMTGATSVAPATISSDTTTNGTGVDLSLTDGPIVGLFTIGNAGDGSTIVAMKLQESDTSGGTYTDVADASKTLTASATANDSTVHFVSSSKRTKRWVRAVVVTSGGGTPSVPISAAVFGRKKISGSGTGYVS